jgi:hypothetical protein
VVVVANFHFYFGDGVEERGLKFVPSKMGKARVPSPGVTYCSMRKQKPTSGLFAFRRNVVEQACCFDFEGNGACNFFTFWTGGGRTKNL